MYNKQKAKKEGVFKPTGGVPSFKGATLRPVGKTKIQKTNCSDSTLENKTVIH